MVVSSFARLAKHILPLTLAGALRFIIPLFALFLPAGLAAFVFSDFFVQTLGFDGSALMRATTLMLDADMLTMARSTQGLMAMIFVCGLVVIAHLFLWGNFSVRAHRIMSRTVETQDKHRVGWDKSLLYGLLTFVIVVLQAVLVELTSDVSLFKSSGIVWSLLESMIWLGVYAVVVLAVMTVLAKPFYRLATGQSVGAFPYLRLFGTLVVIEAVWNVFMDLVGRLLIHFPKFFESISLLWLMSPFTALFAVWTLAAITVAGDEAAEVA